MLGDVKGVVVEDNTFSVSVHYRMVAEGEDRERVNEEVDRLVADPNPNPNPNRDPDPNPNHDHNHTPNPNPDPNPNSPPAPDQVDRLVADMPMLRKTYGKMVYELRPSVDWHKGKAVEWLMEQFSKNSSEVRGRDRGRGRARIYVQREDIPTL